MEKVAPPAGRSSVEVSRPRFPDYFLILIGVGLSIHLGEMSGLKARLAQTTMSALLNALERSFPTLLFSSLGVVLLWPIFYTNQKMLGRKQELTWGEWLWGLAWLGALF